MKKYLIWWCLIPFNIHSMDFEDRLIQSRMERLTPLQQAVIKDDLPTVQRILYPEQFASNQLSAMISKMKNSIHSTRQALSDEITTPLRLQGSQNDTLIHHAAGKLAFRILRTRTMGDTSQVFQPPSDERNFKELGLYCPINKAKILELLLGYLDSGAKTKVINQPGDNGYTPMHIAIISALVCTANGYNKPLQTQHGAAIEVLAKEGAFLTGGNDTVPAPVHLVTYGNAMETFLKTKHEKLIKYPLKIMHFLRWSPFFTAENMPAEYEDWDIDHAVDVTIPHKIQQLAKTQGKQ